MSPEPLMRALVDRSGTPNTLISIRSPTPSFTLEFASRRGDWGLAVSFAGAGCGVSPVTGVWARRWRLHEPSSNTYKLRKRKRRFRLNIPRLLDLRVDRV